MLDQKTVHHKLAKVTHAISHQKKVLSKFTVLFGVVLKNREGAEVGRERKKRYRDTEIHIKLSSNSKYINLHVNIQI